MIIIEKLNILFDNLISSEDQKTCKMYLDKYFEFINKLPEFSRRISFYLAEKQKYIKGIEKLEKELEKEVDLEILRVSSASSNKIKPPTKIEDGSSLLGFYSKFKNTSGIPKYIALKEFIEYMNSNNDNVNSFAYGINFLSVSEKCQGAYQNWVRKYNELNPEGQVWWSYQKVLSEMKKDRTKIDLDQLKIYILTLNNDIKQLLIFGENQKEKRKNKLPIPSGVQFEKPEGSKYYLLVGLNGKCLRFRSEEEDICKLFKFYYENHGLAMNNEDAYKKAENPGRKFVDMMTSLKGTIRRQMLKNIIELKGSGMGSYRLEIKIKN